MISAVLAGIVTDLLAEFTKSGFGKCLKNIVVLDLLRKAGISVNGE